MRYIYSYYRIAFLFFLTVVSVCKTGFTQESAKEEDFFKIMRVSAPESVILEVGGLAVLPNGDLGVTTRRGEVYVVENPTSQRPFFRKFASGLHEVLGIAYKNGALYCAQRGELTKLVDSDMDGRADIYETVYAWPISGNYHEYSFGPKLAPDGSFFVSLNLGFPEVWWHPLSMVPWRGWTLQIFDDGRMVPWATGMRSPCGLSMIDGELFYTDNQGDWVGSGSIIPIKKGSFTGHPAGLRWTNMPNSPIKFNEEKIYAKVKPRNEFDNQGKAIKPENVVNEKFTAEFEMKQLIPELQLPAVWLPHGILGVSNSEIIKIPEENFGPFGGQLLVGDQGQSKISRVFMEKINDEYQGAAIDFRNGFQSGVVRLAWGHDGSLFVGQTNRGWGSIGEASTGIQRLVWNGQIPFEMRAVRAMPDGFEIEFTKPVDKRSAEDLSSYSVESYIYKYHSVYGSPPVNNKKCAVKGVKVSTDGMKARIIVDNLRPYYIHTISLDGVRDKENSYSLIHSIAYYTLNNIPEGNKLSLKEVSTWKSATSSGTNAMPGKGTMVKAGTKATEGIPRATTDAKPAISKAPASFAGVKSLLIKHTCAACHNETKRQVGPAFVEIAKRRYSVDKLINLIKNPQPQNWPDYSTPMPPMPHVPTGDVRKIAAWINSLEEKNDPLILNIAYLNWI